MPRYIAGKIPNAGTRRAATFARDRAIEFLGDYRAPKAKPIAPSQIERSPTRWNKKLQAEVPVGQLYQEFPSFGLLPSITAGAQMRLATPYDKFGRKHELVDIKAIKADLNRLIAIAGLPHIGARFVVWHVGRWAMMEMVYRTPFETGEAAAGWSISPQLRGTGRGYGRVGFRIRNSVSYIIYLEHGHSHQAPQGMVRITMLRAKMELRNCMDTLILWWKAEQYRLRGFKYDPNTGIGKPFDPAALESRIPNYSWKRLVNDLKSRLPLDKEVAHLNAEAFLAMRVDDPKDFHTVHDFVEPEHQFFSQVVREKRRVDVTDHFNILASGEVVKTPQFITETVEKVSHAHMSQQSLEQRAAELEKLWGGRK